MFGFYRFVLALLVALSHYGLIAAGFNPGQWAVIGFYTLSGFLMSRQFQKLSPQGGIRAFYVDRALRIFPLYWVVTILALSVIPVSGAALGLNLALFPMNYFFVFGTPIIVGPAWSLACEAHFYLCVPFLVQSSATLLRILLYSSLALFSASPWLPLGNLWAYAFLPGVLFTFLTGILIDRKDWISLRISYSVMVILLVVFLVGKFFGSHLKSGIHINVCIGYLAAIPLIYGLAQFSPRVKWDQAFGLLSFPLFLVHGPVQIACNKYIPAIGLVPTLLIALVTAAILVVLIEKPFDRFRYAARNRFR